MVAKKKRKFLFDKLFFFKWGASLPGLTIQFIFGWFPIAIAFIISFQDFHFTQKSEWCGMKNFKMVFDDQTTTPYSLESAKMYFQKKIIENSTYDADGNLVPGSGPGFFKKIRFWVSSRYQGIGLIWRNTIFYAVLSFCLTFFVPIIVAILLMEMSPKVIRVMMILWFIPIASMASMVLIRYFYNVDYGLLNGLIEKWYNLWNTAPGARQYPLWLNSPKTAMLCLVLPDLILYGPGLVYIATLQGIPQDLYEAAEIDGAGFLNKIWHITLPRLRPIISMMMVFSIIYALQVMEPIMIMTQGGPARATETVAFMVYKIAFEQLLMGKGNALAVLFFFMILSFTVIQRVFFKESSDD
jgi:multiple sugar transport system permease protein